MISYLNESIGLSKENVKYFGSVLELITKELVEEKDVKLVNFGIFKVMKKARIGRNPKTKEEVMISKEVLLNSSHLVF